MKGLTVSINILKQVSGIEQHEKHYQAVGFFRSARSVFNFSPSEQGFFVSVKYDELCVLRLLCSCNSMPRSAVKPMTLWCVRKATQEMRFLT